MMIDDAIIDIKNHNGRQYASVRDLVSAYGGDLSPTTNSAGHPEYKATLSTYGNMIEARFRPTSDKSTPRLQFIGKPKTTYPEFGTATITDIWFKDGAHYIDINYFVKFMCEEVGIKKQLTSVVDSESYRFTQMAICTDGSGAAEGSQSYQSSTALNIEGLPLNASDTNYVVIPLNHAGKTRLGDVAVLIDHKTGKYVYCIVGDKGPKNQYREVSIAAARRLGYPSASGRSGPSGDFEFIIFAKTKIKWVATNLQSQINREGKKYYA